MILRAVRASSSLPVARDSRSPYFLGRASEEEAVHGPGREERRGAISYRGGERFQLGSENIVRDTNKCLFCTAVIPIRGSDFHVEWKLCGTAYHILEDFTPRNAQIQTKQSR